MLLKIGIGMITVGAALVMTKLPRSARPDTISYIIKMAVSGLFYILLRSLTAKYNVLQPKMIADSVQSAGAELSNR